MTSWTPLDPSIVVSPPADLLRAPRRRGPTLGQPDSPQSPDRSDEALEAVKNQTAAGRRRSAGEFIAKLEDAELKALSTQAKVALLDSLVPYPRQKQALEGMRRMYAVMEMEPGFIAHERQNLIDLSTALKADPRVMDARKDWARMSVDEKQAVLQIVLEKHSAVLGIDAPKLTTIRQSPRMGGILNAYYNPKNRMIAMNTHGQASFGNFLEAVNTLVHENSHHYQNMLTLQLKDGSLTEADPRYWQARIFRANFEPGGYLEPSGSMASYHAYRNQPVEMHAFAAGNAVAQLLIRPPLPKLGLTDAPPQPRLPAIAPRRPRIG